MRLTPDWIEWEGGTDLVISLDLAGLRPAEVWQHISDPLLCAHWFAPYRLTGSAVRLELDDDMLDGEVISCEENDHVLLDIDGIGRLGLRIRAEENSTHDSPAVRISLTHSAADAGEAAELATEFGPVWDTHLRYLAARLGALESDISEADQARQYAQIAAQLRAVAGSHDDLGVGLGEDELNHDEPGNANRGQHD